MDVLAVWAFDHLRLGVSWVFDNVLSITILSVPLWGWIVGGIAIFMFLQLLLRFRPSVPRVDSAVRDVKRIRRSKESE